ncbi:MAG: deoxynucleoside kinase [Ruminococcus sp.]|nr:deoxynucleoside kinase [Ruminococcus sp.]
MPGKIAVLEGLDGSGKSTQFEMLDRYLTDKGIKHKSISFPDYDNESSALVKLYLSGKIGSSPSDVNAYAASSFYAVDRYVSYRQFWEKDYKDGAFISAARYVTSNCIYQMTKLPEEKWEEYIEWLEDYEYRKLGLPRPDQVIFLDMPIEISQKLMSGRYNGDEAKKDIHEADVSYLHACRKAALFTAERCGWKLISCSDGDAPRPIDDIFADIIKELGL